MTEERLIEILSGDVHHNFSGDMEFEAIKLLRDRIPPNEARQIIQGAEHDKIYLVNVSVAAKFLTEEDAVTLRDLIVCVEDDEYLFMFV